MADHTWWVSALLDHASPGSYGRGPHNWLYVLRGQLRVDFVRGSVRLRAGDNASVDAIAAHWLVAEQRCPTGLLVVGLTG